MVDGATAEQFELIEDDPRSAAEDIGPLQLIRDFRAAQRKHGDLISRPLAGAILGISTAHLSSLCGRGRLTAIDIGPTHFLAVSEVMALYRERQGELPKGGRGHKLPSLAQVVRDAAAITE